MCARIGDKADYARQKATAGDARDAGSHLVAAPLSGELFARRSGHRVKDETAAGPVAERRPSQVVTVQIRELMLLLPLAVHGASIDAAHPRDRSRMERVVANDNIRPAGTLRGRDERGSPWYAKP